MKPYLPAIAAAVPFLALGCGSQQQPAALPPSYSDADAYRLTADLDHHLPAIRDRAVRGLIQIGPKAVPPLIDKLKWLQEQSDDRAAFGDRDPQASLRQSFTKLAVCDALRGIGAPAAPQLRELLKGRNRGLRATAAELLGEINPPPAEAVPDLAAALADEETLVRLKAARALWRVDPAQSGKVVPVLERIRNGGDPSYRQEAADLLDEIRAGKPKK